ncbi:Holliday junction branch migration protein RuvA [Taibaiella sp. KBW10]|uniref:Holliday junction branch migration protein RuvA n=1 Tax=Taibaiella sp. KBW10 TaxID=2153357 RepID=UPI000F5A2FEF|nr:Holliday junction branch migration protein RuvA [Taibaiella sp. KBW10]RQO31779.1 Holliday junction branch migration protein RuvA [Taibaiella sp. KBW10]
MIGYLEGKLVDLSPSQTFIDINGLGYEVHITLNTYEAIKDKKLAKLYTHLQVREDAWVLYGFSSTLEKEAFQKLLSVSGVGAATSRILLSSLTANDLSRIIMNGDSKALEKVKGIGAKTAQRIILELKGKLPEDTTDLENISSGRNTLEQDALNALLGLGIPKAGAEAAIQKSKPLLTDEHSVEELIKTALKNL